MGLTNLTFFTFVFLSVLIYYIVPKKYSYISILGFSLIFLFYNSLSLHNVLCVLFIFLTSYVAGILIHKVKHKKLVAYTSVFLILLELTILKYSNLFINTINLVLPKTLNNVDIISPLGLSYYSLIMISYIIGIYWGTHREEKNPIRLASFMIYYPILTSGPFIKYDEYKENLDKHKFKVDNIINGIIRMLWGLFKVLVISTRLNIFISAVYSNLGNFNFLFTLLAILLYSLELYTNFSGSIDIIIGVSLLFAINLPENFKNPFSSQTITEFWRVWHITLGEWLKTYLFYPLLKSNLFIKLNKNMKKKFGKKGKDLTTYLALFILWLAIGIWHGGAYKYILASGILQFIYIVVEDIFSSPSKKCKGITKCLRIARTYLLFSLSMVFFRAESLSDGIDILKNLFSFNNNFDMSLIALNILDFLVMGISLIILFIVDAKWDKIKNNLTKKSFAFKLVIICSFIILILLFGMYGINFNKTDFIYGKF